MKVLYSVTKREDKFIISVYTKFLFHIYVYVYNRGSKLAPLKSSLKRVGNKHKSRRIYENILRNIGLPGFIEPGRYYVVNPDYTIPRSRFIELFNPD